MAWPLRRMRNTNEAEWDGLGDAGRREFNRLMKIFKKMKMIRRGVDKRDKTRRHFVDKLHGIKVGLQHKSQWTEADLDRVMTEDLTNRGRENILKKWADLAKIDADELWNGGKERRKLKAQRDAKRPRKRRRKNGGLQAGGRVRKPL